VALQAFAIPSSVIATPGGVNIAVLGSGVRMPLSQVVEEVPVPDVAPVEEAAATFVPPVVPPVRPPKQDRN
jgi:hypothetical protein